MLIRLSNNIIVVRLVFLFKASKWGTLFFQLMFTFEINQELWVVFVSKALARSMCSCVDDVVTSTN